MYLVRLKTEMVKAIKATFDAGYIETDFRNLNAGIEFPSQEQDYPGIWVGYNPVGDLKRVGIAHTEFDSESGSARAFTRWRFQGEVSLTLVALTSLERDRLYDEMVRVLAFGGESAATSEFRASIENNDWLAVNFDWDEIINRGFAETPGTPWQTDDLIYEAEVAMECFGEFLSDSQSGTLVPLSEIVVIPYSDLESDPTIEGDGVWV